MRIDTDRLCLGAIVLIGILTHFLLPLSEPRAAYFDEIGYVRFVTTYLTGQMPPLAEGGIIDIHPPHGKLVTASVAYLLGYRGLVELDEQKNYPAHFDIFSLRFFPALCGVLIPFLFFFLARASGIGSRVAALASLGLSLDNGLVAHTRMIAMDGPLVVAALLSFLCYLKSRTQPSMAWVVLGGLFAGMVIGIKFTGLSVGAFLILAYWIREKSFSRGLVFFGVMGVVYIGGWWLHYRLIGGGEGLGFFARLMSEHRFMLAFNETLKVGHGSASPWWSWPLGAGPIWLYQRSSHGALWELGNSFFRLGALAVFLASVFTLRRRTDDTLFWTLAFAVSYFPYACIGRFMLAYHYFLPLVWSLMVGAKWLEGRLSVARFWDGAMVLLAGFLLLAPLTYRILPHSPYRQVLYDYLPYFW